MKERVQLFTGFERFWHWSQAVLVLGLLLTGFGMYGLHRLWDFGDAMNIHLVLAGCLIGLWFLAVFWHLVTGQWRQYVPTGKGLLPMAAYYAYGIFSGEAKPYATTPSAKHNPLQRLAYLGFKVLIAPALWISGLLLMFYGAWKDTPLEQLIHLGGVAWVHVAAAYALLVFLVGHVYMSATIGSPWYAHLKAMVTGYEELERPPGS